MENDTRSRIGIFFILVGLAFLVLFIGSIGGKGENQVLYFLISAASLFFGFVLNRRPRSETPSARFSGIRKLNEGMKKSRQSRESRKQEKKKR
jgi:drug/metabolite transporter (DMT)-like permease